MSIAAVVPRGYGPAATIAFVTTRGYSIGTTPPPPPPEPSTGHGGGFGGGWDWHHKRKRASGLREKRFKSEVAERAEVGRFIRELIDPEPGPRVSGKPRTLPTGVDPEIARMLSQAKRADIDEYRELTQRIIDRVLDDLADEDDLEVILMGL